MKISKYFIPILFLLTAAVMVLVLPREGQFKYQYQKGSPWMYENLDASFDFPILKTDDEIRAERDKATKDFTPYFVLKTDIEAEKLRELSSDPIFLQLPEEAQTKLISIYSFIYDRGIMSDARYKELSADIGVVIVRGKVAESTPLSEVFTPRRAMDYLHQQYNIPLQGLTTFFSPNLVFDEATTVAVQSKNIQDISITKGIIYSGQRIVSKGEVVTSNTEQVLNSLKAEYHSKIGFSGSIALLILGQSLMVALCLFMVYLTMRVVRPRMLKSVTEISFTLLLAVIVVAGASLVTKTHPQWIYLLPFPVIILYLDSFFPARASLPLYLFILLPLPIITESYQLLITNLVAGGVAVFAFRYWGRGWHQFLSAFLVYVSYLVVSLSFHLISEGNLLYLDLFTFSNYATAAILIVACYPLVFLFEKLFGFTSLSRLRDLADTGNKPLRELSEKAPGTMQHALQVANLAETAARQVGASDLLCRVGALYHDIGKINNPQFFTENQNSGFNPHSQLTPQESAKIVIRHVEDGMTLAKKYGLPTLVSDFIATHHGKTRTEYFYNVYCNSGGDPANAADFTYPGQLPTSKEQVIVMMADAVEASCRSLSDYTPESIANMVDKVVRLRISEEQLLNADITYRDIHRIQEIFNVHLQEIYHTRISYPSRN